MVCITCGKKPVIELQQGGLCKECFIRYFRKKVYKTIRGYKLFTKRDVLCVACSGNDDSLAVLYLVGQLAKRQRQGIFAICVDECIEGYSKKRLDHARRFCDKHGIDFVTASFKEEFGHTLKEMMLEKSRENPKQDPCNLCITLKRRLINDYVRKLKATRIVTGHNLDDEAQSMLKSIFDGNNKLTGTMGPSTGKERGSGSIPEVKPLFFCTGNETQMYSKLLKLGASRLICPYKKDSYRDMLSRHLEKLERDSIGTKSSIIQNMIIINPLLKKIQLNT